MRVFKVDSVTSISRPSDDVRKLKFSSYVYLISIYFQAQALYLSFRTRYGTIIRTRQIFPSRIHKPMGLVFQLLNMLTL